MTARLSITVEGKGKDIVLLHGWAMHSGVFTDLAKTLSASYRVHLVDLPGHGQSRVQEGFTIEVVCRQLHEQLPASAIWIGWSLGGMIALQMADMYPDQVERLILFATNPAFVQRADWRHGVETTVLDNFARDLTEDYHRALRRFLALQVRGADGATQTLKQLNKELFRHGEPGIVGLKSGLEILKHADLRQLAGSIHCPLTMIFGQRDTLVPVGVIEDIKNIKPDCSCLSIAGAAHIPFISHANECNELIESLLVDKQSEKSNKQEAC